MTHRYDFRFRYTLGDLRACDGIIQEIMDGEVDSRSSGTLLECGELEAAHELIKMCGSILKRVFQDEDDPETLLAWFVLKGEEGWAQEAFDKKHQVIVDHEFKKQEELDRIYEAEQASKDSRRITEADLDRADHMRSEDKYK